MGEQGLATSATSSVLLRHIAAGALAGLAQDMVMHPVDTVRARIQTTSGGWGALSREVRGIVGREGVPGLYRGYSAMLLFSGVGNACYFASYEFWKSALQHQLPAASEPLAGLMAQFQVSLVWTPYDIVKQRMQCHDLMITQSSTGTAPRSAGSPARLKLWTELRAMWRGGELYRGLVASWFVWGPFSAAYFATFESSRRRLITSFHCRDHWTTDLVAGVVAGVAGSIVSQPPDVVKTRLQVLPGGGGFASLGIFKAMFMVIRDGGMRDLWRGLPARIMWLAPGCAITITAFEALKGDQNYD